MYFSVEYGKPFHGKRNLVPILDVVNKYSGPDYILHFSSQGYNGAQSCRRQNELGHLFLRSFRMHGLRWSRIQKYVSSSCCPAIATIFVCSAETCLLPLAAFIASWFLQIRRSDSDLLMSRKEASCIHPHSHLEWQIILIAHWG